MSLIHSLIETLKANFKTGIVSHHGDYGDETLVVERRDLFDVLQFLRDNPTAPFDLLLDICGVDYLGQDPRFEVVYHLYSLPKKLRLRICAKVPEPDPKLPSVFSLWESADWFEREAYDMFGIRFEGHPNLKRLLMWEEFEGYPLRKDYPINRRQPIPKPSDIV